MKGEGEGGEKGGEGGNLPVFYFFFKKVLAIIIFLAYIYV